MCVVAALLAGTTPALEAQLKSVPVYSVVGARPGWVVALDYGSGLNDASGHARHLGVRVGGVAGRLTLAAAGGAWDAGTSTSGQFGGTALLRVIGSRSDGLVLNALAGAGYTRAGPADTAARYATVPLGIAVQRSGLRTPAGAVTPWLISLLELDRVSFGDVRATQAGVGMSGGFAAAVRDRIGVHAALEWLKVYQRNAVGVMLPGGNRITVGVGVHFLLSGVQ